MHCSKPHSLFDHLVGDGEQSRWEGETEQLRSMQVNNEFELVARPTGRSAGFSPLRMRPT